MLYPSFSPQSSVFSLHSWFWPSYAWLWLVKFHAWFEPSCAWLWLVRFHIMSAWLFVVSWLGTFLWYITLVDFCWETPRGPNSWFHVFPPRPNKGFHVYRRHTSPKMKHWHVPKFTHAQSPHASPSCADLSHTLHAQFGGWSLWRRMWCIVNLWQKQPHDSAMCAPLCAFLNNVGWEWSQMSVLFPDKVWLLLLPVLTTCSTTRSCCPIAPRSWAWYTSPICWDQS